MQKSSESFDEKKVEAVRRGHVRRTNLEMREQTNDYVMQGEMSNISQRTSKGSEIKARRRPSFIFSSHTLAEWQTLSFRTYN